ncbi:MAG: PAS domain S-box protein, partial [Desulforhopalus sp.]|nr:PAS domain S-box protein [Desulforhopalus sp.]
MINQVWVRGRIRSREEQPPGRLHLAILVVLVLAHLLIGNANAVEPANPEPPNLPTQENTVPITQEDPLPATVHFGQISTFWPLALATFALLLAAVGVWLWSIQLRVLLRKKTAELQQSEEALRATALNFSGFFDTVGDLLFVVDADGFILHSNAAVAEKLGYSPEALTKMRVLDLHPAEHRQKAAEIITAMVQGKAEYCPLPLASRSGVIIPVETRVWQGVWNGAACLFGISKDLRQEQEALQKFDRLFTGNPAPMAVTNADDGVFIDVNEAFLQLLGYSRAEVIGRTTLELGIFADPDTRSNAVSQIINHGRITNWPMQVRCKDGTLLEGLFSGDLLESQGKRFFLTVMIDQTNRILAEKALQRREEQYRGLFESLIDVYYRFDREGKIVMISPSIARVTGFLPEEILNTNIRDFHINPEDNYTILSQVLRRGFVENYELAVRSKDRSQVWLSCTVRIVRDQQGNFVGVEGIARDITEQRKNTRLLGEESVFRKKIIDTIADGLCVCQAIAEFPFVHFSHWNHRMTEITGYTMAEINAAGWYQSLYPDPEVRQRAIARMDAMRQGDDLLAEEWQITRADGETRTVSISSSFLLAREGEAHILAMIRDITEQKRFELEKMQMQYQMQQLNKMQSLERMAGAIAHHFNNQLAIVLGYLEMLEDECANDRSRKFVNYAIQASRQAVDLSHLMLKYTGHAIITSRVVDLSAEVSHALPAIESLLDGKAALKVHLAKEKLIVGLSPEELQQVIFNLISNAQEAMADAGGSVQVTTGLNRRDGADRWLKPIPASLPKGEYAFFEVADTGCGMDQNTVANMFDPFFSTKYLGRGLGLAVVSGIVRACQGTILVNAKPGLGTSIRVV